MGFESTSDVERKRLDDYGVRTGAGTGSGDDGEDMEEDDDENDQKGDAKSSSFQKPSVPDAKATSALGNAFETAKPK